MRFSCRSSPLSGGISHPLIQFMRTLQHVGNADPCCKLKTLGVHRLRCQLTLRHRLPIPCSEPSCVHGLFLLADLCRIGNRLWHGVKSSCVDCLYSLSLELMMCCTVSDDPYTGKEASQQFISPCFCHSLQSKISFWVCVNGVVASSQRTSLHQRKHHPSPRERKICGGDMVSLHQFTSSTKNRWSSAPLEEAAK